MLDGYVGQQLVAQKTFGENAWGPSREGVVAASAVALFQFIADNLFTHGFHINNGAGFTPFGIQGTTAVGALVWSGYPLLTGNLLDGNSASSVPSMARFGSAATLRALRFGVGFDRDFGRGSRGAEGAFF